MLSRRTGTVDHIVPLKNTAQNTSLSSMRHSLAFSTDTDCTAVTDNTLSHQEWAPCSVFFVFFDRGANGRKHNVTMMVMNIMFFLLSLGK